MPARRMVMHPAHGSPRSDTHRSILIVDDEQDFCAVVTEILQLYGFTVFAANNAAEAFSILERAQPDLILTDVMMPETDGLTLIRKLRSHPLWSKIPAIVLSAKASPEDLEAARRAGASACLPKPFSVHQLRSVIEAYVPAPGYVSASP